MRLATLGQVLVEGHARLFETRRRSRIEFPPECAQVLLEVSGAPRKDKEAKVATAKNLWVPAVNNHGGFGRWNYVEVKDPWDAMNEIRLKVGAE